ncbi:hypothetical protein [Streptomyces sp. LMG1-1-1.1]|uniref:hypothetical protein n=1 Tax=Streptomyces sp. LMG1-1-1.1 TaxID=3135245 RepID=UPI0034664436
MQAEDGRLPRGDGAQPAASEVRLLEGQGERGHGGVAAVDAGHDVGRLLGDVFRVPHDDDGALRPGRDGYHEGAGAQELLGTAQVPGAEYDHGRVP